MTAEHSDDSAIEWPANYWAKARYYYFRTNEDGWGVSDNGRAVCGGLDKNDAAAVACILNGDRDLARSLLA